jgi:hypothetical protein
VDQRGGSGPISADFDLEDFLAQQFQFSVQGAVPRRFTLSG